MSQIARNVPVQELESALLRALMVGPVRALELLRRVPEEFGNRGWPRDEDSFAVVACAIGACKINAGAQRFRLPPALLSHSAWFELAANVGEGGRLTADQIVEGMGLERLMEPA